MFMNSLDPADIEFEELRDFGEVSVHKLVSLPNNIAFLADDIAILVNEVTSSIDFSTTHVHEASSIQVLLLNCITCFWISLQSTYDRHESKGFTLVIHKSREITTFFEMITIKDTTAPSIDNIIFIIDQITKAINSSAVEIEFIVSYQVFCDIRCVIKIT